MRGARYRLPRLGHAPGHQARHQAPLHRPARSGEGQHGRRLGPSTARRAAILYGAAVWKSPPEVRQTPAALGLGGPSGSLIGGQLLKGPAVNVRRRPAGADHPRPASMPVADVAQQAAVAIAEVSRRIGRQAHRVALVQQLLERGRRRVVAVEDPRPRPRRGGIRRSRRGLAAAARRRLGASDRGHGRRRARRVSRLGRSGALRRRHLGDRLRRGARTGRLRARRRRRDQRRRGAHRAAPDRAQPRRPSRADHDRPRARGRLARGRRRRRRDARRGLRVHEVDGDGDTWWAPNSAPPTSFRLRPLAEVSKQIMRVRAEARERKGWIMNTYLLRERPGERLRRRS